MDNMDATPGKKMTFAEAQQIVIRYSTKYPTKIRVKSIQAAQRAYKNATGTSREELYAKYVDDIISFAIYISRLRSEATD